MNVATIDPMFLLLIHFKYVPSPDSQRPKMRLSTYYMRTRVSNIAVSIKFSKPVFGFNSSLMSISGGYVKRHVTFSLVLFCQRKISLSCFSFQSYRLFPSFYMSYRFQEISRRIYLAEIEAADADGVLSISIPENVTADVAGNKNTASNVLQVTHCECCFVSCSLNLSKRDNQ